MEGVAEEATMAAHLFNDIGELEEVDIPEFEVLAGGDTVDEGTFKFLMEFAEDFGGSDAPTSSTAADTGTSTSALLSNAHSALFGDETSTLTSGPTSSAPTELNEDIDLLLSTDFESAFQSHQMLSPANTYATPLPTTAQSLISRPSLVETMDTASRTSPLQTPSSFSQQPMSAAASTVQINPATQAQELPSNSGAAANLLQGTSITLTKIVSTSNVSDAAVTVAPQPGVSSGAVILTENLLAAAVEEGEIFTTTTSQIKPLLPPPCPAVPPQTPPMQSDTAPAVHQLEQPLGLPKTFSLAAAGRPRKRKPVDPSSCIYACDNCTKAFTTKFNLQRHINMHCLKSIEMGVPLQGPPSASQPSRRTRGKTEAAAAQASADSEHRNAEDSKSNVKMAKKTAAGLNTQKSVVPTTPAQTSNPSTIQISRVQAAPAPPNHTAVQPSSLSVSNAGLPTVTIYFK